jgi:CDP-glucose 4,6-dehydratase
MRYLITGHTGFKGAWLTLLLAQAGHEVVGLALDPEPGSLYESAAVADVVERDVRGDVRDAAVVSSAMRESKPDVLIHMAAQPLVRESYRNPRWTMETNVMGTLNVLEAAASDDHLQALVIVTTDKVYRNVNQMSGYIESDPLGGDDPYSASKAMADILTHSWAFSFAGPPTAIARAGNVIGGGDVSKDRLFPDVMRALSSGQSPVLRYPLAVRPWQHVLDCVNGYVALVDALVSGNPAISTGSAWNFGPDERSVVSVGEVTRLAADRWGSPVEWSTTDPEYHEAGLLALDARAAQSSLGWANLLPFEDAVHWTVDWYRNVYDGASPGSVTRDQITAFTRLAQSLA